MTDVRDDPSDVLNLLNSLGFVGITAPQLKAFMKDLKMYRKIKERENEQWKKETRKKILMKQECMLNEMLRDTIAPKQSNSLEDIDASNDSSQQNDPLVRIKVHCVSEFNENEDIENEKRHCTQSPAQKCQSNAKNQRPCRKENREDRSSLLAQSVSTGQTRERSKSCEPSRLAGGSKDSSRYVSIARRNITPRKVSQRQARNHEAHVPVRPLSAPEFTNKVTIIPKERSKSVASDRTGLVNPRKNPSRCSSHSQTKSFIRPWRLQPEVQRAASARKSDPVALYQKYQQAWKQISFPGEEQHAHVRWAIREKMLGTDPNPRPILKKSQSLMSIKKR